MKDFGHLVLDHIRTLGPYVSGKPQRQAEGESGTKMVKMASNENPFGPSPKALEAIREAAAHGNVYPDNEDSELRRHLATHYKIGPEQILVTGGSTQFLDIIARSVLAPGLNAVTSERTFIIYPLVTKAAGAQLIEVPMRDDAFNLEGLLRAINRNTRLVFLANPNNPTGTMFDASATRNFLQQVPDHVLVVLDEAYCDFAGHFARARGIEYSRSLDRVREGRNLIVLRTFSKAHGLAGIRVGYGFGPAQLIHYFARVRPAFSVSTVAEAAAIAALDDAQHVARTIENNAAQAPWLLEQISNLGIRAVPTSANFIYLDFGPKEDAALIAKRIQARGVIVRPLPVWGIPYAIRVTIGTPEQNQLFIEALQQAMAGAAVR